MIKAFMFDLDGTLIDENYVMSLKTIESLKRLKEKGYLMVASSGRPVFLSNYVSDPTLGVKFFDYVYGNNGSELYDGKKDEFTLIKYLTPEEISIIGKFYDDEMFTLGLYEQAEKNYILVNREVKNKEVLDWIAARGLEIKVIDFNSVDKPYAKIICIHDAAHYDEAVKYIESHKESFCSICHSSTYAIEIVPFGVSKGTTVSDLCKKENLKKEEIIAFGDSSNDIPMLLECRGVLMGNAKDDLKKVIKEQTLSVKDDGIYDYLLKHHFLD